jgi:acetyl-CoA acetyltransferase
MADPTFQDRDIVVLGGARTPFGTFMGSLKDVSAIELGAIAATEALKRSGVDAKDVDQVVLGNVLQTSKDAIYFARHIALKAGVPIETPALTVNRLSFQRRRRCCWARARLPWLAARRT